MSEFFAMGGYAGYVWPAYAMSMAVLIGAVIMSLRAHAKAEGDVRRLEAEAEAGENV